MEPSVKRVVVLLLTLPAHRKTMHRRKGTIIGETPDDGISGATIGTVDEGITKPAIGGIQKLAATVAAERNIGRNECFDSGTGTRIPDNETILNNTGN